MPSPTVMMRDHQDLTLESQRFGGPFTTEQVEDVKTFLRIVVILLVVGPVLNVFADTPSSDIFVIFLNLHFTSSEALCSWNWIIINGGVLRRIVSTIFLPFYIWIVFSVLRNRVPKILYRLGFGMLLYFLWCSVRLYCGHYWSCSLSEE